MLVHQRVHGTRFHMVPRNFSALTAKWRKMESSSLRDSVPTPQPSKHGLGFMKDPQYILWWTNIAMENGPFIDGFPIKKIVIFHGYVSLPECISAFSIGKRSKQQQNRTIIWPWVKIHWCLDLTLTYSHKSVIEFPPETWYTKVDHRWPNFGGSTFKTDRSIYPLVNKQKTIENGHWNSGISH